MKLYSGNEYYKLYQGDMLDILETIKPNTIDSVVTDPPYELNFMGKGWDNSGIAFQSSTWQKCYEVLKPGGYLLAFGGSRTFHRIACAIEDAGFEIRDTIMWLYGSGFPKSMDISKQLDKRNGRTNDKFIELGNYLKEKIIDTDNMCAEKIGFSPALVRFWKLGERIPNKETWLKLKSIYGLDNDFDWLIEREEAEREVIGTKEVMGKDTADIYGKYKGGEVDITIPSTDLAKKWQGWGTALKPSFEPIIVARKPFKGSLVDNVIEYGVGGLNIDECRVGNEEISYFPTNLEEAHGNKFGNGAYMPKDTTKPPITHTGRFPANTILTYDETDFDEVCGGFPDTKNSKRSPKNSKDTVYTNTYTPPKAIYTENNTYGDSGSASRYFYCAKASKKDRDEGLDEFEAKNTMCDRNPELASANMPQNRSGNLRKNTHPTVKPTELMQYLIRLVTPNGGTVLDPFNGSGSTGKAVMYENRERDKDYKYIGIELTEEYLPIAKARIEYVCNLEPEINPQISIFDLDI